MGTEEDHKKEESLSEDDMPNATNDFGIGNGHVAEATLEEVSNDVSQKTESYLEKTNSIKEVEAENASFDDDRTNQDEDMSSSKEIKETGATDEDSLEEKNKEVLEESSVDHIAEATNEDDSEVQETEGVIDVEEVDEEDDDFGSFDEASFEEFQAPEPTENDQSIMFSSAVMNDAALFGERLEEMLDLLLPKNIPDSSDHSTTTDLLTEGGSERLKTFSTLPRLNPPNWTRLKMRHGLLVSLGVPINLDELSSTHLPPVSKPSSRRRSTTEDDIQWGDFKIPELESLNISDDRKNELMTHTLTILSKIEDSNLNNTTEQFLQQCSEEVVDEKYREMQDNYAQLVELSSVWQAQIQELRNSQEMFESVVQNMVGYRQKLQRNEILESLSKSKRGKRVF